jgi:cyclase
MNTQRLSDRVLVITGDYFDEHMTVVATDDGLVVVDTLATLPATRAALPLLRDFSAAPVRLVIHTHPDVDHVAGNAVFAGARILCHTNAARLWSGPDMAGLERLRGFVAFLEAQVPPAHPALAARRSRYLAGYTHLLDGIGSGPAMPPTKYLAADCRLVHGGVTFDLAWPGPGHTDADLLVYIAEEHVLLAGDLVTGDGYVPVSHPLRGGSIGGLLQAVNRIDALAAAETWIVPGHGVAGHREILAPQRRYLEGLRQAVDAAKASGESLESAKTSVRVEAFEHHLLYDLVHPGHVELAWKGGSGLQALGR